MLAHREHTGRSFATVGRFGPKGIASQRGRLLVPRMRNPVPVPRARSDAAPPGEVSARRGRGAPKARGPRARRGRARGRPRADTRGYARPQGGGTEQHNRRAYSPTAGHHWGPGGRGRIGLTAEAIGRPPSTPPGKPSTRRRDDDGHGPGVAPPRRAPARRKAGRRGGHDGGGERGQGTEAHRVWDG